jgi:hypothetical protein
LKKPRIDKYDELILVNDNGITNIARDLWIKGEQTNVQKLNPDNPSDNQYIGYTKFKFECSQWD